MAASCRAYANNDSGRTQKRDQTKAYLWWWSDHHYNGYCSCTHHCVWNNLEIIFDICKILMILKVHRLNIIERCIIYHRYFNESLARLEHTFDIQNRFDTWHLYQTTVKACCHKKIRHLNFFMTSKSNSGFENQI